MFRYCLVILSDAIGKLDQKDELIALASKLTDYGFLGTDTSFEWCLEMHKTTFVSIKHIELKESADETEAHSP